MGARGEGGKTTQTETTDTSPRDKRSGVGNWDWWGKLWKGQSLVFVVKNLKK